DPVRPRVEQWNPHRRALGDIGREAAALAEQLLAPVAQRASDHPGLGHQGELDAGWIRARDRQRLEAVHVAAADHPELSALLSDCSSSIASERRKGKPPACSMATRATTCCSVIVR